MSGSGYPNDRGMLAGKGASKSALARLIDLYKGDTAFRSMTDFVAIGALALMFLSPPSKVHWPWSGSNVPSPGPVPGPTPGPNPGLNPGGTGPGGSVAGLALPIPFPQRVSNPTIPTSALEVDSRHFKSSSAADQPRLAAALIALGSNEGAKIIDILREADGNDRNVALMRGIGLWIRLTPTDAAAGLHQLRVAMEKGQPQARALVGRMLRMAIPGIQANPDEGMRLIEAAASAGDEQGMRLAATALLSGEFGRVDAPRAYGLAKRAADAGDRLGMLLTSRLAADGIGTNANGKEAEVYLRKSAEAGQTEAQYALGSWLLNLQMRGLSNDLKEALAWFERAYEKGHDLGSLVNRAYILSDVAKGPPYQDARSGRSLLEACAAFRHSTCQNNLAYALSAGIGGPADLVRAFAHYTIAVELKHPHPSTAQGIASVQSRLSAQDKQAAEAYLAELRKVLRPLPPQILVQYPGVVAPAPVARAPERQTAAVPTRLQTNANTPVSGQQSPGPGAAPTGPDLAACTTTAVAPVQQRIAACTRAIDTGGLAGNLLARTYANRGYYRWQAEENAAAEKDLDEAIKLDPKSEPNYFVFRGAVRSNLGRHDNGLADIDVSIGMKEANAFAHAWRGEVLRRLKRYDQAVAAADRATALEKNLVQPFVVRTDVHMERKNWREAVREATAGLGVEPNRQWLLRQSGDAYIEMKEWKLAITAYDQFIRLNSRSARAFNQRGRASLELGAAGYDAALTDFTEAIKLDDKDAAYYANRALITAARGQDDRAIADLDKAIELDPKDVTYYPRRAELHRKSKRYDDAISDLTAALDIEPGRAAVLTERGRMRYLALVDLQEFCAEARKRAAELANRDIHGGAGGLRCSMRPDYSSALRDLNEAAAADKTALEPHFWAGHVLKLAGQPADALKAFENSYRINPGNGNAMVQAGHIWLDHFKDERKALELYNEAIRVNGSNADAYANRGNVVSRQRGGMERAIADFRKALNIDQGHKYAKERLDWALRSR